ncbi:CinA family protein [Candidatus Bipolaricaulota bacterium]|nr:CinA family protein [Candidatus Bipolaricaulota bacterium]
MPRLEEQLGKVLNKKRLTISVAESCTGGLLASRITDVSGASDYFRGGVVAYQNEVKQTLLGVPAHILAEKGAISRETAQAMAKGCRKLFQSDIAAAITGIAGPTGGTQSKPIGLVYIAVVSEKRSEEKRFVWSGNRMSNKEASVGAALKMMLSLALK